MMNENNIRQLIERFLNAETTLEEEQTLYEYFSVGNASKRCIVGNASERSWTSQAAKPSGIPDDLKPYIEVFQSFAVVKGIDKPVTKSTPTALRNTKSALSCVSISADITITSVTMVIQASSPKPKNMLQDTYM